MSDPYRRLLLLLESEGRPGLLPLLEEATGAVLGNRFRLEGLLALGRQSYVFAATDLPTGDLLVVKQPAFDYRRPLDYNRAAAAQMRRELLAERQVLTACTTGHLPRLVAVLAAPSPVPAASASPVLSQRENFLVEERIAGVTLTDAALGQWRELPVAEREAAVRRAAQEFVGFWEALRAAGWHYGDLSPNNLLIEDAGGGLRVVDAGSAVPAGDQVVLRWFTPAYTTPCLFAALSQGRPVPGSLAAVLPALAKLLHFALTRREPFNGALPGLDELAAAGCSPSGQAALAAMLRLDAAPDELSAAREALTRWSY